MTLKSHALRIAALALALAFAGSVSAGDKPIKVACIGDSITVGVGIRHKDRSKNSYPSQLQKLLGDKYSVKPFGKSGATILKKGNLPYSTHPVCEAAKKYPADIVVIMLGTNDAKTKIGRAYPRGNWAHKADYKADYVELVKTFQGLASKPKVFICYPVPAYKNKHHISGDVVKNEIIPFIDQVAKETDAKIIDLHKPLAGKPELIPDGVHPNVPGAKIMAETIAAAITNM